MQTLPNSFAKAAKTTAPSSRNPDNVSGARPWLDGLILLIFPLLLNISLITQDAVSRQVASLIFFALFFKNAVLYSALSIAWQAKVSSTTHYLLGGRSGVFNSLSLLLVLIILAELRGFFERVVNFLDFLGFALWAFGILAYTLSVFMLNRGEAQRRFLINAFLAGLALYVLINIAGHIAGLHRPMSLQEIGANTTLSMIGITYSRVAFPFSSGLNNFGIMSGFCMVVGGGIFIFTKGSLRRLGGLVFGIVGLSGAALADSRGVILFALVTFVGLAVFFRFKKARKGLVYLPILLPVMAIVTMVALPALTASGILDFLHREGAFADRLGLSSGRDVIWGAVYARLIDIEPVQLIGYGMYGQFSSGVTKDYSWIFAQTLGFTGHSIHNAMLQTLLDIGYLGVAVWIILWMRLLKGISALDYSGPLRPGFIAILGCVIFMLLMGQTEVAGTAYLSDSFGIFLMLCASVIAAEYNHELSSNAFSADQKHQERK